MTRLAVTGTREWPVPPDSRTIQIFGDLHRAGGKDWRSDILLADLQASAAMLPSPVCHLVIGDQSELGNAAGDANFLAWAADLPETYYPLVGNHDCWGGSSDLATKRTGAEAATGLGMPALNHVVDLGFVDLVIVGPSSMDNGNAQIRLSADTLTWLDAQLAAAGDKPVYIAAHAPLYNTVTVGWSSLSSSFYVNPRTEIEAILADHSNVVAWLSGHTHTPMEDVGLVKAMTYGANTITAVNASAIHYVGQTAEWNDPIRTIYVTLADDGTVEVRARDHGARSWIRPTGTRARTAA